MPASNSRRQSGPCAVLPRLPTPRRVAFSDGAADSRLSVVALEGGRWRYKGGPGFSWAEVSQVRMACQREGRVVHPIGSLRQPR